MRRTSPGSRWNTSQREVYGTSQRGAKHAERWIADRKLQECHQLQTLCVIWSAVDALMLYDKMNPVNSACAEILLRHAYALESVYGNCNGIDQTRGKDSKCQWRLMQKYCVVRSRTGATKLPKADAAVKRQMEQEASFIKYLQKMNAGESA